MLRDAQNQYGSNLPTPFFLDFEKPHGFLAYALLRAHNCQIEKSAFLICPCHEIYRVEAVGLSLSNYT